MSEKQKYEAKRLVEILVEMNILQKRGYINYYGCLARLEDLKHYLTEAIGIYQSEELEKDLQKFREWNRKTEE